MTIGKDIDHKEDTPVAIPLNPPAILAHPQGVITVQPHLLTILHKESKFHLLVGHATNSPNLRLNETYGIPMCLRRLRWASVQIALLLSWLPKDSDERCKQGVEHVAVGFDIGCYNPSADF